MVIELLESSYGVVRRLDFVLAALDKLVPKQVLDFGCGTGAHLTQYLAVARPKIDFVGVDEHIESIKFANQTFARSNLKFFPAKTLTLGSTFDAVVLSEVLEHVDLPELLLADLNRALRFGGTLILTVPNGFGPFEWSSLFHKVSKLLFRVSPQSRIVGGCDRSNRAYPDTLGSSPHVNFFTFKSLNRLMAASGFTLEQATGRSVFCGWLLDSAVRSETAISWNTRAAGCLPLWMCSGWMFTFKKTSSSSFCKFERGLFGRFRRWVNLA